MKKEWIKLGISFSVLVILAVVVSLHREQKEEEIAAEEEAKKLFLIQSDSIERIEFENPLGIVVAQKGAGLDHWYAPLLKEIADADRWHLVNPPKLLASSETLRRVLDGLKGMTKIKDIRSDLQDADGFGLADPSVTVRLVGKDGELLDEIRIGDDNTADTGTYVSFKSEGKIILANNAIAFLRDLKIGDWKDGRWIGFGGKGKLSRVQYMDPNGKETMAIAKSEKGWRLSQEPELPLTLTAGEDLKKALSLSKAETILVPEEVEVFKKDKKTSLLRQVRLTFTGSKSPSSVDLDLYQVPASEKAHQDPHGHFGEAEYYVERKDLGAMFAIDATLADSLNTDIGDVVSLKAFSLEPEAAGQIRFSQPEGEPLVLQKDETQTWKLFEPVSDEIDRDVLGRVLSDLRSLEAESFEGLTPPTDRKSHLEISIAGTSTQENLRFYQPTKKDEAWLAYAWVKNGPGRTMVFADDDARTVESKLNELRSRHLHPGGSFDLSQIQLELNEKSVVLEQEPEDKTWTFAEARGYADTARLDEPKEAQAIANAASRLRIGWFEEENPTPLPEERPLKLTFKMDTGEVYAWTFAKVADVWKGTGSPREVLASIPADDLKPLMDLLAFDVSSAEQQGEAREGEEL